MGTRGIYGVRKNGVDKCTYNHWDTDPMFLGKDYLGFIAQQGQEGLNTWFDNLVLVADGVVDGVDNYKKLRDYQGNFDRYSNELNQKNKMIDNSDFLRNGLSCEYGYIANLDSNKLEFYVGFQREPQIKNRYSSPAEIKKLEEYYKDKSVGIIYPCHIIAEIPLNDFSLENVEQMVSFLVFAEAAYNENSLSKEDIDAFLSSRYTEKFVKEKMTEFNKAWDLYIDLYKKYQPKFKEKQVTLTDVMERVRELNLSGGREQASVLMDIEYGREAFGFTYDDLMALNDFNFAHDVVGIQNNIDRSVSVHKREKNESYTEKDFNFFRPRVCDIKQIQENEKAAKKSVAPKRDVVKNAQVADKTANKQVNKKK